MKKNSKVYLIDILRAATDIQTFTISAEKEDFFSDRMLQDAVIREISIIGEAAKRLPVSVREREKHIPWKKIIGMRNIVVHDYSDIDLSVVWDVVKKELPGLIQALQKIIQRLN